MTAEGEPAAAPAATPRRRAGMGRWTLRVVGALAALVLVGLAVLTSPIGKRFIADQIAGAAPASGLRIKVGRIEGDIFGKAVLRDVVLLDPKGAFLTVPLVEVDWRPLNWLFSGLDIRTLAAYRGTLLRRPELLPGDPDAPILPDFDIRVDRFEIDRLALAPGLVGNQTPVINLLATADIRSGRVYLKAEGQFGARDALKLLLDAQPEGDRFDLDLDYRAPAGGVVASLLGIRDGYRARILGDGSWHKWDGTATVQRGDAYVGAFRIGNRQGRYDLLGLVWPGDRATGVARRAMGEAVAVHAVGTLKRSIFNGQVALTGSGLALDGRGALDLARNRSDGFSVTARLRDPALFGEQSRFEDAALAARISGPFRQLALDHTLTIGRAVLGTTELGPLRQQGTARYDGSRWTVPLAARIGRVRTGQALADPRLVNGTLSGVLTLEGTRLASEALRLSFPDATATLALSADLAKGNYGLAGPVDLRGLTLANVGTAAGRALIVLRLDQSAPWSLTADLDGRIAPVSNATIANLAGPRIALRGGVTIGGDAPLRFHQLRLAGAHLTLALDGKVERGVTTFAGRGRQDRYGPFTIAATYADNQPRAELVFADPYPAAGLKDVRVALAPSPDGFAIETEGQSLLGRFEGALGLVLPAGESARIAIDRLDVWKTRVTGALTLGEGGVDGRLRLAGGGLDGTIALAAQGQGQNFTVELAARNASFGGATALTIARADIEGKGYLRDGNSTLNGNVLAEGIGYGQLFIGRIAAQAALSNGRGTATASLAGRRGSRFDLQANAAIAPDRIALAAQGQFAGRRITLPRRAVLTRADDGWALAPTQITYGRGAVIASGTFGGSATALDLALDSMPLSLIDIAVADLGLGGSVSGLVEYRATPGHAPTGSARIKVAGLTRSGLVLTSSPLDLALVAELGADALEARAVFDEAGQRRGRLQALVSGLPADGGLADRLMAGRLAGQLRYTGPAEALWRLAAIDALDLTGPLEVSADMGGTLAQPQLRGALASENLRVQSSLSGTDIRNVAARGSFAGSRLRIARFAGTAANGGKVSGSGTVDLADLGKRGPGLDIRLAAANAQLLNARGLSATVTGPLRIVSDGIAGTIAGRVQVQRASWRLGSANAAMQLPRIRTREINLPLDAAPVRRRTAPWRYLIDASAPGGVMVDGLGLDSEWQADIRLRGTTDAPRIGGEARVVRGDYSFAGTRFALSRGRIVFDEAGPIDPRLDIAAQTSKDGLAVTVKVLGRALQPEISFASTPALPEEELLSRLLFGNSITSLSATDALQLGSALASLRGGAGLDPINKLRTAIGLDRLRIVNADPATGRETGVAVGKNIGRGFYVELVTDGRGYSATEVEFRVTGWLSLLGTVSTVGRNSVTAQISKDY